MDTARGPQGPTPTPAGPIDRGLAVAPVIAGGFLMGAADIVPGVSGGTVALLLGIYERLVHNIRVGAHALGCLVRGRFEQVLPSLRLVEWPWLVALLTGIATALVMLASTIEHHLEVNPIPVSGLFLGLVVGSVAVAWGDVKAWTPQIRAAVLLATVVTFLGLGLRSGRVEDPSLVVFLLSGAFAICAMILPGVSGSFLLLMVGMYEPVLDAANDGDLVPLLVFVVGAAAGLGAFSTVLTWALDRFHDRLLGGLIGLMIGSLRVLWPWPAGEDGVGDTGLGAPDGQVALTAGLALLGLVAVVGIARLARARLGAAPGPIVADDQPELG